MFPIQEETEFLSKTCLMGFGKEKMGDGDFNLYDDGIFSFILDVPDTDKLAKCTLDAVFLVIYTAYLRHRILIVGTRNGR